MFVRLMERLTPSVGFDVLWMTNSPLFVCLLSLESITFEQQVPSNKLLLGTNSCKEKERGHFKQRTLSIKAV